MKLKKRIRRALSYWRWRLGHPAAPYEQYYVHRVLSKIPDLVALGGVFLGGIWWITHRREEVAAAEGKEEEDEKPKA